MKRLFRQFAIQRAISDLGLREGMLYVSVQDAQGSFLAHTGVIVKNRGEEAPFSREMFQHGNPRSRLLRLSPDEEIFEVAKPVSFENHPVGLIRIGYSPKEIDSILHQVRKTVVLSVFFFLIFGVLAITLIWVNQNRHLKKMKELEDRIRLADRLSSLGHLAAGVAHEIRNPLNAIGMGIQRLKREFPPPEESKQEEFLSFTDLIFKEIRRVNQIIEQFLTLSRPFQLHLKESRIEDLLKNGITLLREEAASMGIHIEDKISPSLPPVLLDEEKLTQALINIMKNGMQAMGRGGQLRIEAHSVKDSVEINITDTGVGIPADRMEKIFNYYYTTKDNGVGLGLPITHRIIEAHGGRLKVKSQVGKGTCMTLTLPINKEGGTKEQG
jgi:signal transduction histidine kinase